MNIFLKLRHLLGLFIATVLKLWVTTPSVAKRPVHREHLRQWKNTDFTILFRTVAKWQLWNSRKNHCMVWSYHHMRDLLKTLSITKIEKHWLTKSVLRTGRNSKNAKWKDNYILIITWKFKTGFLRDRLSTKEWFEQQQSCRILEEYCQCNEEN